MKKSNSINWITPFNVTIMKSKCPKEHVNFMIEAVTLLLDNEIVRMTVVYADGSLDILIRQKNGTFSVERRNR